MGFFSELQMEQSPAHGIQESVQTKQATAAVPQPVTAPSPFISNAFSGAPIPPPPPRPQQVSAAPAAQNAVHTIPATPPVTQPVVPSATVGSVDTEEDDAAEVLDNEIIPDEEAEDAADAEEAEDAENAKASPKASDAKSGSEDDDAKRKAHEEAEAKRKAEHDAKFAERRAQEQAERDRVAALPDDAAMQEAMSRVSKGFEQLTRRNMKDCVSEYVQTMCISDPVFSRKVMNPVKSMPNCVKYINNKAREYVKKEMEDNDVKPDQNGIYGSDVPDDLVYQWAVDYFNDPNAKEDEREDEKFTPKPYVGGKSSSTRKKKEDEKAKKRAEKEAAAKKVAEEKAKKKADDGQMSLLGAA
ncbi:MAG: hypothetical protein J5449_00200 [Oscillospiraceae bacterium]|nr:hypothetical protein [Oscillospiraceae bacterium]